MSYKRKSCSINTTNTKIGIIIGIVITVVVLVAVGAVVIYGAKEPEVVVFDNRVQIKAMYGLTIDFSDITEISLLENSMSEMDVGVRVNGADTFGTLQGHFKSDTLGETLLFVHLNSSPTIRIERNNDKDIYLSFSNGEKTIMLFNELNTAIDRDNNIEK
jgi:hypothetical protein